MRKSHDIELPVHYHKIVADLEDCIRIKIACLLQILEGYQTNGGG
jgi:hypothetical protein